MRLHARRVVPAVLALGSLAAVLPGSASAHPLGNFTVNRAIVVEVDAEVRITAVLDLAEIPAYEVIREVDTDGDDALSAAEGAPYAAATCAAWSDAIEVSIDGARVALGSRSEPRLSFPLGAGGLDTLRLECAFAPDASLDSGPHRLDLRDTTTEERSGWREVTARGHGVVSSDVPDASPSGVLTSYPEASLASPPDVRAASLAIRLAPGTGTPEQGVSATPSVRGTANDPLAALIGGPISPGLVVLAIALSLGLGAAHALSPGHGKTLVAAYVIGAGGSARSALQIGLWVAVAHTAGVFVLGAVTLVAGRFLLPEQLIEWLSLASGVVVTTLGLVLLSGVVRRNRGHDHDHAHGHDHGHAHIHPHPHPHDRAEGANLTWRGAVALGFAGGAVPSASALIVFLVALATDRVALGIVLIACFGIGMAVVLGGLALAASRVRAFAADRSRWPMRGLLERVAAVGPMAAGVIVLVTGLAFTAGALSRLA